MTDTLTRRAALWLPIGAALGIMLQGNSCALAPAVAPEYVTAIQAIGSELSAVIPALRAAGVRIPASAASIVSSIVAVAGGIGIAATQSQGATALATIEAYLNQLAPLVGPIVAAAIPGAGPAIGLIVAALPIIEPLVNLSVSLLTPLTRSLATLAPAAPVPTAMATAAPVSGRAALDLLEARAAARG